jgi:hypothetical protein
MSMAGQPDKNASDRAGLAGRGAGDEIPVFAVAHVAMPTRRTPNRTPAMMAAGEYWIRVCSICGHPGGAHFLDDGCTCPDCPGYNESPEWAPWSDQRARELRARPDARPSVKADAGRMPG